MKLQPRDMTAIGMFAALIAVGAFLRIDIPMPLYTMHFTLQWFFVLTAAMLLGKRLGFYSVLIYLLIGLAGIPVFAAGGGPGYILRPGFGFLLGFLIAAYVMGMLTERLKSGSFFEFLFASALGLVFYYGVGAVYFYFIKNAYVGESVPFSLIVVQYCLMTVPPDFILCILASLVAVRLKRPFQRILEES